MLADLTKTDFLVKCYCFHTYLIDPVSIRLLNRFDDLSETSVNFDDYIQVINYNGVSDIIPVSAATSCAHYFAT